MNYEKACCAQTAVPTSDRPQQIEDLISKIEGNLGDGYAAIIHIKEKLFGIENVRLGNSPVDAPPPKGGHIENLKRLLEESEMLKNIIYSVAEVM